MRNLKTLVVLMVMMFSMPVVAQQVTNPPASPAVVAPAAVAAPAPVVDLPKAQIADPSPVLAPVVVAGDVITYPADAVAVVATPTDVIPVAADVIVPVLTVPATPDQAGAQVVQAVDYFAIGQWIAGILLLIGVAIFFVNRYTKKNAADKA